MMGNLIVRQVQFLLEKMNLRQNSYRQVEGVRRSKRMRVTDPLMSLSPVCLSASSLPLSLHSSPLSFLPLSPSLSCPSPPLFPASLPCLSVSLLSSPLSPPLFPISPLFHFCLVLPLFYLSPLSLSPLCLFLPCPSPCSVSPSPVSPCSCPLSPPIGRYLFLHPVSLTYHSSLSVPHLYTPYTTITV